MHAVLAIAVKDVRLLLRDRVGFFFTFVFPLLIAIFFGSIFGGGGDSGPAGVRVGVVDLDRSDGSRAFLADVEGGTELVVTRYPDRESGLAAVQDARQSALIVVPPGFGAARSSPFAGKPMELEVAADPSRRAAAGMLEGVLTKYGFMQLQSAFTEPEKMRTLARDSLAQIKADPSIDPARKLLFDRFFGNLDVMLGSVPGGGVDGAPAPRIESRAPGATAFTPLRIRATPVAPEQKGPKSAYAITFPQGMIWGVMGCALSFAIALIVERSRGTLIRLRVSPAPPWQLLAGKALACFVVTAGLRSSLIVVAMIGFGVRPTSPALLVLAIACVSLCFVGVMNLLAVLSPSERAAGGLGWGVLLVLAMIGGGMVPVDFLPRWMQSISQFSPIRWAILAIEAGVWRPLSLSTFAMACAILLGIGALGFVVGLRVFGSAERT